MMRQPAAVLAACLALAGCGFHPLYGARGARSTSLARVYVDLIPNRAGQLLRQALQVRLEGDQTGVAKRFTLGVAYAENVEALGIQADNSSTRNRDVGVATWSLHSVGSTAQIAGGTVRTLDGYNVIDEQFFYADLSEEAAQHRLANALAEQIVTGLAVYFEKHPEAG